MKHLLHQLLHGSPLTAPQAESAFTDIMDGTADPLQTAALLTLLAAREPTIDELCGAAIPMRRHAVAIDAPDNVIDTCGTGGVGSTFFNISTAAALVVAACGVPVAKHGNRSVSSRSGSSDVLVALGVNIDTTPTQEAACLRESNICFAFAPKHHPAMKHVGAIRQALGFPTLFNLLGPLTNPAGARRQVIGTRTPALADKLLEVLIRLGAERAMVLCGSDATVGAICEISITGPTHVAQFDVAAGSSRYSLIPADLHLPMHGSSVELEIDSPAASAQNIREVFAGRPGPARDIVVANAAAGLWVGGAANTLAEGATQAAAAIDSGAAQKTLDRLIQLTQQGQHS
jgi:anthranilate phosphoribosyltransferase